MDTNIDSWFSLSLNPTPPSLGTACAAALPAYRSSSADTQRMKLKQLESLLSEGVLPFEEPKVDLEQVRVGNAAALNASHP